MIPSQVSVFPNHWVNGTEIENVFFVESPAQIINKTFDSICQLTYDIDGIINLNNLMWKLIWEIDDNCYQN